MHRLSSNDSPVVMTKKQQEILNLLIHERAILVRSQGRHGYVLVRQPRAGQPKSVTLAVFRALRPFLDPRAVRPGQDLPNGELWIQSPATVWRAAG